MDPVFKIERRYLERLTDIPRLIVKSVMKLNGMNSARKLKKFLMLTVANVGSRKGLTKSIIEKGRGVAGTRGRTIRDAKISKPKQIKPYTRKVQGKPIRGIKS